MTTAAISHLKNHLPEIVHEVENGEDIQITRHGKPVAVIVSLEKYNTIFKSEKGIFSAYLRWRQCYPEATGFTDNEIKQMGDPKPHEPANFSWD